MSRVRLRISMSLDGFVAGPCQSVENPLGIGGMRLHEWAFPLAVWRSMHGLPGGEQEGVTMNNLQLKQAPVVKTGMLIRRPVAEVFEAFVNPDITSKFWFTRGSGRLEVDKQVQWEWEMYGISIPVTATAMEREKRIVIEWPGYKSPTTVEWTFAPLPDGTTFVGITHAGFTGDGDEMVRQATDSTQGFSLMLAGLKAFLEHGVRLNLVADRYPRGVESHEPGHDPRRG